MNKKIISYSVSSFGLGILASAVIYPMGYLESISVFRAMTFIGNILIGLGLLIRPSVKKNDNLKVKK